MKPLSRTTKNFQKAMEIAGYTALKLGIEYAGSEHFIYAFLCIPECEAYKVLVREGICKEEYGKMLTLSVNKKCKAGGMTLRMQQAYDSAVEMAEENGTLAGTAHMLYKILCIGECYGVKLLRPFAKIDTLKENTLAALRTLENKRKWGAEAETTSSSSGVGSPSVDIQEVTKAYAVKVEESPITSEGDGEKYRKTSRRDAEKLAGCGIDMTERALKGKMDPVIGRKKEIEKVVQVLSRRQKNNPVLVGEPGVGKSAIVEGLSQLIVKNQVPEQLYNKKVFSVDLPGMLAGTRYRGDFEEKLKNLLDTVMEDGDIVLFIDEIHTIVGAGGSSEGSMDVANILKPLLARGD